MYTSLLLVALHAPGAEALIWETDYQAARKECARLEKPMAVFLGSGKTGYGKVVRGGLDGDARQLLADRYVCVHVDTSTAAGKRLAKQFEMADGQGLVLSDRTGELQAFRHEGDLAADDLASYLRRYSQAGYTVRSTETVEGSSTSFYPAEKDGGSGRTIHPAFSGYPVGGFGGCPGGNCGSSGGGRRRR